jgi:hypothetical protein
MNNIVDRAFAMSDCQLLATYLALRCQFAEQKFARDTEAARLAAQKAQKFNSISGNVTERRAIVEADKTTAAQEQQLLKSMRDVDLLKAELDTVQFIVRMRAAAVYENAKDSEDPDPPA